MKPYLAFFKSNLQLTLRNRSVLFFNWLFPFIFFFAFAELFHAGAGGGIAFFLGRPLGLPDFPFRNCEPFGGFP